MQNLMLVVEVAVAAVAESVDAADSPDHILVHIFFTRSGIFGSPCRKRCAVQASKTGKASRDR